IHDLKIQDLRIGDQGEYTCQVTSLNRPAGSAKAFLRVLKNLDGLKLMQRINSSSSLKLEPLSLTQPAQLAAGKSGELICEAASSNPAATISWTFSDGARVQVPEFSKQKVEKRQFEQPIKGSVWIEKQELKDKLFTVTSVLEIDGQSVTDARHNLLIECHAKVLNFELRPMSASTRLYVTVPPTVSLAIEPHRQNNEYHEHDRVTAVCTATGRPDNFVYTWSIDSNGPQLPTVAPSTSRLTLTLTRRHDGQTIRCSAANHEKSDAEAVIRVRYGPKFEPSLPTLYSAEIGGSAELSCQADARPEPTYAWRRGDSVGAPRSGFGSGSGGPVVGQMSRLRLTRLRPSDFGEYVCTVSGAEFSSISRRVLLAQKAQPRCESAGQQFARLGRSFRLECRIVSVPAPASEGGVQWWRNGRKLETGDRVRIYREDFLGGTTSFVHFEEVQSNDFGIYNCTATNEMGSQSLLISLTIEDNIPVAFIAGASTALVMVLVFMLVLLCVCRKGYWDSRAAAEQHRSAMGEQSCSKS
uniref:Nephrin n=1 Tax=Macrostomum lignano TaxID=282301 RepID=A0A1I8H3X7_9PLAT